MKAVLKQKGIEFSIKFIHDDYIVVKGKKVKLSRDRFQKISSEEGFGYKSRFGLDGYNAVYKNGSDFWEFDDGI